VISILTYSFAHKILRRPWVGLPEAAETAVVASPTAPSLLRDR
jgi:hypothetical protein